MKPVGILLTLLTIMLSVGCTANISIEEMMPGIKETRNRIDVSIEYHEHINQACRETIRNLTGKEPDVFTYYRACSVVYPDAAGEDIPTCLILLPESNWQTAMEHEIFHCMGFAHQ